MRPDIVQAPGTGTPEVIEPGPLTRQDINGHFGYGAAGHATAILIMEKRHGQLTLEAAFDPVDGPFASGD